MMSKPVGLYIHVPFCRKKCPYCDFYSVGFNPQLTPEYSNRLAKKYMDAVIRNIRRYQERFGAIFDTVYFGGGTPILLAREISQILSEVKRTKSAEITVECNPVEMDEETLKILFGCGVNRLSVGLQSASDSVLRALGRTHTFKQARQAVLAANKVGFRNISADLMLGVPNLDRSALMYTAAQLKELPITHISAYLLKIEPNTAFGKNPPLLPDDDETAEIYLSAVELLNNSGFTQYEISNFAKDGMKCCHNLKYWHSEEYVGIGPAAHSYYNGKRYAVARNLGDFLEKEFQEELITEENPDKYEESVLLGLRLSEGISLDERLEKRLKFVPRELYRTENGKLSLTAKGFLVSNEIISTLLS